MKILLIILVFAFVVSLLALSYVQTRAVRAAGTWSVFRQRRFFDLYWRDLSPLLRALVWSGLIVFFLAIAFAVVGSIVG